MKAFGGFEAFAVAEDAEIAKAGGISLALAVIAKEAVRADLEKMALREVRHGRALAAAEPSPAYAEKGAAEETERPPPA
jgi:hypothetical protein